MSDSDSASEDERELPDAKRPRLHFGSLEEAEKQRREGATAAAIQAGIEAGNINITQKGAFGGWSAILALWVYWMDVLPSMDSSC